MTTPSRISSFFSSFLSKTDSSRQPGGKIYLTVVILAVFIMNPARAAESLSIRLNTVGYLRLATKQASLGAPCTNFAVIRVADGNAVFQGQVTGPVWDPDTQEHLYTADFSKLKEPGAYQLEVPGLGQSAPFRVAADVYREPFYVVMRGFYLWRCGTAVSATNHGLVSQLKCDKRVSSRLRWEF